MNEYREDDALVRMAMEELPMSNEMPQNLKTKLTDRALETKRKTRTARRPWMVGAMTCGLAVLALGAFFILPKPALGRTWSMISDAVNQVQSFQLEVRSKHDGNAKSDEPENVRIAVAGSKMLVDAGGEGVVYIDGESIQCYDKDENKITKIKLPGTGFAQMITGVMSGLTKGFDLKKEFARYEQQYGKDHIRIQPIRSRDGRDVYDVIMTAPEGPETISMTVDAETNLPTDIFVTENENGKRSETTVTLRYNDAIVIEPHFPAGVKVDEVDISKLGEMGKGFDGEKIGKEIESAIKEGFGKMDKHGGSMSFKL